MVAGLSGGQRGPSSVEPPLEPPLDGPRRFAGGTPQGRGLGCTGCLNGFGFVRRRGLLGGTWGPGDGSQEKCMVVPLLIYTGAFRRPEREMQPPRGRLGVGCCLRHKSCPPVGRGARSMALSRAAVRVYRALTIVCGQP